MVLFRRWLSYRVLNDCFTNVLAKPFQINVDVILRRDCVLDAETVGTIHRLVNWFDVKCRRNMYFLLVWSTRYHVHLPKGINIVRKLYKFAVRQRLILSLAILPSSSCLLASTQMSESEEGPTDTTTKIREQQTHARDTDSTRIVQFFSMFKTYLYRRKNWRATKRNSFKRQSREGGRTAKLLKYKGNQKQFENAEIFLILRKIFLF